MKLIRVSTNLTEQISRRFQEGFEEKWIQDMFALLRPAMHNAMYQFTKSTTLPKYITKT